MRKFYEYRLLIFVRVALALMLSNAGLTSTLGEAGSAPEPGARFGLVFGEPSVLQDLGADWSRSDFTWAGIERTPGVFDFTGITERVAAFAAAGKTILPILDYAPAWDPNRAPSNPETLDQWANYVDKTVRHFQGTLKYWQVWNEPNLGGFWKPQSDPVAYAELLRRTYETIKKIDPNLQVIGVNTSDIDLAFAEQVFQHGGLQYLDVVAVQPYRLAPEVGHFEEVAALRALMKQYGGVKPIWFTEMGNDSRHFPFSDSRDYFAERPCRRQSAFLTRYMTIIQAADIQKVFWFAQTAEGASLLDQVTGKPRPSYRAYQHLIQSIGVSRRVRPLIPPGANGLHAYLFTLPDKAVLVSWSVRGPQNLVLPQRVYG
ncbi:MAG TPA: glycosyl hydrolase, partial [Candidatus Hydrogenedentes bacterium]|nr:glycosyl hydrolase [Candidatus Hydrogenedentota bacterium]